MKCSQCRSNADFYEMVDGAMCPNCLSVNNRELRAIGNELRTENERLRYQRDLLALNRSEQSPVIVTTDQHGNVQGVGLPVGYPRTGTDSPVKLPAALEPPAEGEGGGA